MDNRGFNWVVGLAVLLLLGVVGVYTYNLGIAHGLAEGGRIAAAPGQGAPIVVWPHPWHFGYFPLFPLVFFLFWFLVLRAFLWRRGGCYRGYGHDRVPPFFDEWHRRVHEQHGTAAGADTKA